MVDDASALRSALCGGFRRTLCSERRYQVDPTALDVDRRTEVLDGDQLIELAARHLSAEGRLRGNGVAVTVMTNLGFHRLMGERDIRVLTTDVGDRHVLERRLAGLESESAQIP